MTSLSVVVPVFNGAAVLPTLLAALGAQQGVGEVEVVVVDNASTDASARIAAACPIVSAVLTEPRRGSYTARNTGWRAAHGDVVAFTDADCRPEPGWLAALAAGLEQADLVAGAVVAEAGPPGRWASWWSAYDRALYLDQEENVRRDGFAATANLAVRREVLADLAGFPDAMLSGGDLHFTRTAVAAGHRLLWCPDAVVGHRPRSGLRETWALWRRLGRGYTDLASRGQWPVPLRRDPVIRRTVAEVQQRARSRGIEAPPLAWWMTHTVARSAVLRGRVARRA